MESRTFSIRLYNPEIELLQAFQESDESLNQTIARLIRDVIGAKAVNNTVHSASLEELITEEVQKVVGTIGINRELIKDEIDNRTAYLATAMNEIKGSLEDEIELLKNEIKQLKEEKIPPTTVRPKATRLTEGLNPNCPNCEGQTNKHGRGKSGNPRFKCKSCGKTFEQ